MKSSYLKETSERELKRPENGKHKFELKNLNEFNRKLDKVKG